MKHEEVDNLTWAVVTDEQVYNEFSSGTPDVSAYRWLMKMLYDRANGNAVKRPKYLLLMGDGNLKEGEKCNVEDVLALATHKVKIKKEYNFRSDSHLKKARLWNLLLPIRRYLLFIYKLILKKSKDENA
jgi:hypothetical protein